MILFRLVSLRVIQNFFRSQKKLPELIDAQILVSQKLTEQDISQVYELVFGTVRNYKSIQFVLSQFLKTSPKPITQYLLSLAVYELLEMEGIPTYATVNSWVTEAGKINKHQSGFVNAILRNIERDRERVLGIYNYKKSTNWPDWITTEQLKSIFSDKSNLLYSTYFSDRPSTTGYFFLNPSEQISEEIATSDSVIPGIYHINSVQSFVNLDAFKNGQATIIDQSSLLTAIYGVDDSSTSLIDLCASPGGKLSVWLKLNSNLKSVVANDLSHEKIKRLTGSLQRLQLDSRVELSIGDARFQDFQAADVVLLDAPCSGSGVINRKPDIRYRQSAENLSNLILLQRELLEKAATLVNSGGKIVYSTCSFLSDENDRQIDWFLENHPEYMIEIPTQFQFKELLDTYGLKTVKSLTPIDGASAYILRKKIK